MFFVPRPADKGKERGAWARGAWTVAKHVVAGHEDDDEYWRIGVLD